VKPAVLAYKPISIGAGIAGGVVAGLVFRKVWEGLGHEGKRPKATAADSTWAEVLTGAVLEAVIFAVVKTAIDRGSAEIFHRATGVWPGK
jgi:hypothetical protein